jgi:hypothetical protein
MRSTRSGRLFLTLYTDYSHTLPTLLSAGATHNSGDPLSTMLTSLELFDIIRSIRTRRSIVNTWDNHRPFTTVFQERFINLLTDFPYYLHVFNQNVIQSYSRSILIGIESDDRNFVSPEYQIIYTTQHSSYNNYTDGIFAQQSDIIFPSINLSSVQFLIDFQIGLWDEISSSTTYLNSFRYFRF